MTRSITNPGFLSEFLRRHEQMPDRPFCWILGSGASVQSGIPSGGALVQQWLGEMYEMESASSVPIETWATATNLGIDGFEFERAANFYPWIYQRRFLDFKEQGYAMLEKIMEKAEPSFGYSVLANIMANTPHKVAVTTNFDNLIADALSIYTRTFPLVCGHESLTGYIRSNLRRPLIAKIHRDLLLEPFSNPEEISKLPRGWDDALKKIFARFTPVVIGYGGNDGSLMNFLKAVEPIEGGIFWCHRHGSSIEQPILDLVERHRGKLVPILGFDELMLQLQEKLKLEALLPHLKSIHARRVDDYQKQFEALTAALRVPVESAAAAAERLPVTEAADAAVERLAKENDWWGWNLRADAEPDLQKREEIYRAGLEAFPNNAKLTGNFASFMHEQLKVYDEAEQLYRRALSLNPTLANTTANFGGFMCDIRKNYDEAERLFRRSIELDPNNADSYGSLAWFLEFVRRNDDEAESMYRRATELEPGDGITLGNYAQLLATRRRDTDAREHVGRALKALGPEPLQVHAEVLFTLWLLDCASGADGTATLGKLKWILGKGFSRSDWSFERLLDSFLPRIPESEHALAKKLSDAILDESKIPALEDEPIWKSTTPVPL